MKQPKKGVPNVKDTAKRPSKRKRAVVQKDVEKEVDVPTLSGSNESIEVHEAPELEGEVEETEELSNKLRIKELAYIAQLRKECSALRGRIDQHLNTWLALREVDKAIGNARQRQLREMSWTYLSLNLGNDCSRGIHILPCAITSSEVYQLTHLINAFRLTLEEDNPRFEWVTNGNLVAIYPLAERGRDEIECLEAKKELYTYLLTLSPETYNSSDIQPKVRDHRTLDEVYNLLQEVKEVLSGLSKSTTANSKGGKG